MVSLSLVVAYLAEELKRVPDLLFCLYLALGIVKNYFGAYSFVSYLIASRLSGWLEANMDNSMDSSLWALVGFLVPL